MSMFAYNPHGSATDVGDEDDQEADGRHPATEECLRADDVSHPEGLASLDWDDVEEGDELPTLFMPITVTRCVYLASATRDFAPTTTTATTRSSRCRRRDMFLNTPFNMGI